MKSRRRGLHGPSELHVLPPSFTPQELLMLVTAVVFYRRNDPEYSPTDWKTEYLPIHARLLEMYEAAVDRERNPV